MIREKAINPLRQGFLATRPSEVYPKPRKMPTYRILSYLSERSFRNDASAFQERIEMIDLLCCNLIAASRCWTLWNMLDAMDLPTSSGHQYCWRQQYA